MYEISREFEFSYAHRLWHYEGKCNNLHGHNAKVRVTLELNQLDELGLSVDFGLVKREIERWVEQNWDHKTFLSKDDPLYPILQKAGVDCIVLDSNPTSELFARLLFQQAIDMGLPIKYVDFWETSKSVARYAQDKREMKATPKDKASNKAPIKKSAVR